MQGKCDFPEDCSILFFEKDALGVIDGNSNRTSAR